MNAGVPPTSSLTDADGHVWSLDPNNNVVKDSLTFKFSAVAIEFYNGVIYACGFPILGQHAPLFKSNIAPSALGSSTPTLPHWFTHNADDSWTDTGSSVFQF